MTVQETAQRFDVDPATVRRWLHSGCPCVRRGSRGPGRGAILDFRAVESWRGRALGQAGLEPEEILQRIALALWDAIEKDSAHIRAGISRDDACAAFLVVWERVCKNFNRQFKFDQQPDPIRALMREL